jgi:hypothetical protein
MRLDPGRHSRLPDRLPCPLLRFQDQISLMGVRSRPDTTLLRMNHCQPCTRMLRSLSRRFLTVYICTLDATKKPRQKRGTQVQSAQPTADGLRTHPTRRLRFWHYLRSRLAPKPSRGGIRGGRRKNGVPIGTDTVQSNPIVTGMEG